MRKVLFLVSVIGVSGLRSPNPVGGVTSPRSKKVDALELKVVNLEKEVEKLNKIVQDPKVQAAINPPKRIFRLMHDKPEEIGGIIYCMERPSKRRVPLDSLTPHEIMAIEDDLTQIALDLKAKPELIFEICLLDQKVIDNAREAIKKEESEKKC